MCLSTEPSVSIRAPAGCSGMGPYVGALRQRLMVEYMLQTREVSTRKHGLFAITGGFHKVSRVEISNPHSPPFDTAPSDPVPADPASSYRLIRSDVEKRPTFQTLATLPSEAFQSA
ncbi:hypothetical protein FRB91_001200 [Serendipita sp. 411]|nr:hypothetical protein FRB91_001200 [Serendipita sp. 411]